jgi:hypothetical protein
LTFFLFQFFFTYLRRSIRSRPSRAMFANTGEMIPPYQK